MFFHKPSFFARVRAEMPNVHVAPERERAYPVDAKVYRLIIAASNVAAENKKAKAMPR